MKNLKSDLYNKTFSHIYIEKEVKNNPLTKEILEKYKDSVIIDIEHYKDVFCRSNQNANVQKKSRSLIIAAKKNNLIYEGAAVCQSFGNEYFYYTSCVMNCIYDCEYCYLQGMYPSSNMVIFVNIEDIFEEVKKLLRIHSVYLCISYDTDLAAIEGMTGYTKRWVDFVRECNKDKSLNTLKIEIRTKSAHIKLWEQLNVPKEVILAYTISPDYVIANYEHGTPNLDLRIASIKYAMELGIKVRLCFDPIIYCKDFEKVYEKFLDKVINSIDMELLEDISVGTFRISQDYLKNMRKIRSDSSIVNFPYVNVKGVYQYPKQIMDKTMNFVLERLGQVVPKEKIFIWT